MCAFVTGLAAKVLLANPLGALWERMRALPDASMGAAWLGIAAFGLQIYFDFHGYSLMAIGMGRMFGFTFPRNFHHPYAAASVRAFWRRWHMTLGAWFREYVYLPLGGSRGGTAKNGAQPVHRLAADGPLARCERELCALGAVVFSAPGAGTFFYRFVPCAPQGIGPRLYAAGRVVGMGAVCHGYPRRSRSVLAADVHAAWRQRGAICAARKRGAALDSALCCIPGVCTSAQAKLSACPPVRAALFIGVLLLCIAALVAEDYNPFLYFRF